MDISTNILNFREGTLLRKGIWSDWNYIDSQRKEESNSLGFLPKAVYESVLKQTRVADRDRWKYQDIYITEDNGEQTGFCMVSYFDSVANIFQIVVRRDARRWHRALLMADEVEKKAKVLGKTGIKCRVAVDLESNLFWQGIGYKQVDTVTSSWLNQRESKSKRPLYIYNKTF